MIKNMKLKFELTFENGEYKATPYKNRLIPYSVLIAINNAVQDTLERINGKADWKKHYIRFSENGKTYYQVDNNESLCKECCFEGKTTEGYYEGCQHPHYSDGTKGICEGKIYKEDKNGR